MLFWHAATTRVVFSLMAGLARSTYGMFSLFFVLNLMVATSK